MLRWCSSFKRFFRNCLDDLQYRNNFYIKNCEKSGINHGENER